MHLIARTDTYTLGRTPLEEGSARRRPLHLTTHKSHNRLTSMPSAGFEPAIPASERPQTLTFNRPATRIGGCLSSVLTSCSLSLLYKLADILHFALLSKGTAGKGLITLYSVRSSDFGSETVRFLPATEGGEIFTKVRKRKKERKNK